MSGVSPPGRWRRLTIAVLVGLATMGVLAFIATLFQTPGLEGPVEAGRIAVVVTVLGAMAVPLVWWDDPVGYAGATVSGAAAVFGIALYLAGVFGQTRVAPAAYLFAVLGALLVLSTVIAWRDRLTSPGGTAGP